MIKQVPKQFGQNQNKNQIQQNNQIKNKQVQKQFKNINQQKQQQGKQQIVQYFNKQTFNIIVVFLRANEILQLRLVNKLFNKLFINCAPVLLDYFDQKDLKQYKNQKENQQNLVLPKLIEVNLNLLRENLKNKGMYAYVEKLPQDDIFSVDLIFDIITLNLPPWRKAKFNFPLKVKTIIEKYDFNLYNLNDQQLQLINQRQNFKFANIILYNDDFDEFLYYVKNLMQVAAFQDYKYFCDWYEIEKENQDMEKLREILRNKTQQQQK